MRSGCQAVSTFGSRRGIDGITEAAQPINVTTHRSLCDLKAFGEFDTPPQSMGLKEREQLQCPTRGIFCHI